jgi:single-strand DNA-binding protein
MAYLITSPLFQEVAMSTLKMPNINQIALSGRLVQDPELRTNENGSSRLLARIAVNRAYRDRNDVWQEETSFFDIVLWQKAAETFAPLLSKGTPVFITGRLQSRSWRDDQDQPHSRIEVHVRNLQILEKADHASEEVEEEEVALQAA